ncbi:zinc finger protein GAI-ASSOCIATED FACTOR 1-like [Beta vulgaris subsp. vulgaris]|uniref:zinc finger protein GAI-ASSOCIATED FACTOR 1-like n=1 Tax=Beta vulgaris subsp. vulgaris TaxID=3555 RepID=UPI0020369F28|nr:zinc finger protein GAI-ASSOCIATED FACTOR 1-like [Beta vulgaris subsp. vulgaris]
MPDPDAEVIALSPKTLMATNRFVCEICNRGFQRDQNLQLHRRGHNLPWKLRQRSSKEVKKRVYVCPEISCVHHDPSRALGDLTGIKKHFCRKHDNGSIYRDKSEMGEVEESEASIQVTFREKKLKDFFSDSKKLKYASSNLD